MNMPPERVRRKPAHSRCWPSELFLSDTRGCNQLRVSQQAASGQKERHIAWSHLDEMSRLGESVETAMKLVVARG